MRILLLLLAVFVVEPLAAQEIWTLKTGPEAVVSIPLDPVQPVPAWRGGYGNGIDVVWVYATRSPNFFPPRLPEVNALAGTPWTVVVFYPEAWKAQRQAWWSLWRSDFLALYSLPNPGAPIVFPAVLRKN